MMDDDPHAAFDSDAYLQCRAVWLTDGGTVCLRLEWFSGLLGLGFLVYDLVQVGMRLKKQYDLVYCYSYATHTRTRSATFLRSRDLARFPRHSPCEARGQ